MATKQAATTRARIAAAVSPFTCEVPAPIRNAVIDLQYQRLRAILPTMCVTIMACALAMALALRGSLPAWQQVVPPAIIIAACLTILLTHGLRPRPANTRTAFDTLRISFVVALALGMVGGAWCVNAFRETSAVQCVVAPVFIALSALVASNGLSCAPRAAIAGLVSSLGPVAITMLAYRNLGVQAMAVVILLLVFVQSKLALIRFSETVQMLDMQHQLDRLAGSDPLTQLDNRRAFMRKLAHRLERNVSVTVAIADLDEFKAANDDHGHHAGDEVLIAVARRMSEMATSAVSIARLGGDEFALLFDWNTSKGQFEAEIEAVRAAIAMPYVVGERTICISTSIGTASSLCDGMTIVDLMQAADRRLYRDKGQAQDLRLLIAGSATKLKLDPETRRRRRWREA